MHQLDWRGGRWLRWLAEVLDWVLLFYKLLPGSNRQRREVDGGVQPRRARHLHLSNSFFVGISAAAGCMAARRLDVFRIFLERRNSLCLVLSWAGPCRGSLSRSGYPYGQYASTGCRCRRRRRAGRMLVDVVGEGWFRYS